MARQLTEKQQKFLDVLFEEAKGNPVTAKKLAGYSNSSSTTDIMKGIKEEILEATQRVIPTLSWTNKNPQNSRHHEHKHPNSIISGVFYFSTTDTTPIKFHKSDYWGLKLEYKNFNNYNGESIYVPISSGELILFPSSTTHSVPTNQSNVVRYSLSFNTFTETGEVGSKSQLTYLNIKE